MAARNIIRPSYSYKKLHYLLFNQCHKIRWWCMDDRHVTTKRPRPRNPISLLSVEIIPGPLARLRVWSCWSPVSLLSSLQYWVVKTVIVYTWCDGGSRAGLDRNVSIGYTHILTHLLATPGALHFPPWSPARPLSVRRSLCGGEDRRAATVRLLS